MNKEKNKWKKTQIMEKRLGLDNLTIKLYKNRPVIHRDSIIDGGVYLGQNQREAIVVDSQKYPKINELYEIVKTKSIKNGVIRKSKILKAVYDTVAEAMPIQNNNAVEKLINEYKVKEDDKISLDVFLDKGMGVCRHDALACAVLLEKFKKDGIIKGKPSVDRNSTYLGGHAWCRYTNSGGDVFILDVAQKYLGKLEDAVNNDKWAYQRPEDF